MIKSEEQPDYEVSTHPTKDQEDAMISQSIAIIGERLKREDVLVITSPNDTRNYLMLKLAEKEHEVFAVMFLDNRHQLIAYEEMFRGTIDGASVYPREVAKAALKHNAAALILAHNHPSGIAEPSQSDLNITGRLKKACAMLDIRVLDHLIVGGTSITSLAERGEL